MRKICILILAFVLLVCMNSCNYSSNDSSKGEIYNEDDKHEAAEMTAPPTGVQSNQDGLIFELNSTKDGYILVRCDTKVVKSDIVIPDTFKGLPVTEIAETTYKPIIPETTTSIVLPNGLIKIGHSAFNSCKSLTEIVIPDSVKYIGGGAFRNCTSLKKVTLGSGITSIEADTFEQCDALEGIKIPDGVVKIGSEAFFGSGIKTLELNSDLQEIGSQAFFSCSSLESVIIPSSVTQIGRDAFSNCYSLKSVVIGDGELNETTTLNFEYDSGFEGNSALESIVIQRNNVTIAGSLFDGSQKSLLSLSVNGKNNTISRNAFDEFTALKVVTLKGDILEIGESAFQSCSLETVTIDANVEVIRQYAFLKTGIKKAYIGAGVKKIESTCFTSYSFTENWKSSINIYCEAKQKPDEWAIDWTEEDKDIKVYWGQS